MENGGPLKKTLNCSALSSDCILASLQAAWDSSVRQINRGQY